MRLLSLASLVAVVLFASCSSFFDINGRNSRDDRSNCEYSNDGDPEMADSPYYSPDDVRR